VSDNSNAKSAGCLSVLVLTQGILAVLRATGTIDWSWAVVLIPVYIMTGMFMLGTIILTFRD
jgi:hypothetical protein